MHGMTTAMLEARRRNIQKGREAYRPGYTDEQLEQLRNWTPRLDEPYLGLGALAEAWGRSVVAVYLKHRRLHDI